MKRPSSTQSNPLTVKKSNLCAQQKKIEKNDYTMIYLPPPPSINKPFVIGTTQFVVLILVLLLQLCNLHVSPN